MSMCQSVCSREGSPAVKDFICVEKYNKEARWLYAELIKS